MSTSSTSITNPFESAGDFSSQVQSLDAARLLEVTAWADGMARHPQGGEWRKRGEKLMAEGKAGPVAEFAYASLLAALGEREPAARLLVDLCEKAAGAHAWGTVIEIARRALALDAGPPAARWLVKAMDETGDDEARFLALVEAHDGAPAEPRLGWRLSRLYESRGLHEAALDATEASLEALARRHDAAGMEEVLLFLLDDPQADYLRLTLYPLPLFAKGGEAARVASFFELAWPALVSTGLAGEAWKTVRSLLLEVPAASVLNHLVPDILSKALPHLADVRPLLEEAGFPNEPASEWIPRFEKLLPFAPGAYAEHGTMGVGRVTSLSREEVWLDFPSKPGHRMSLRAAHQALLPVSAEDLAVLASWEPKRVAELRTSDPVDLVARALHRLRGSAATTDLKKVLVRYAVPEKEWTSFWNAAKGKLAKDPRIDASHAFQQRYALGTGKSVEAARTEETSPSTPIPRFDRGADAKKVLATLKKFLAQHPGQAAQLVRERGTVLRAWRDDPELEWRERITALLALVQGSDADTTAGAPVVLARALNDGFELRELTTAAEQALLLDLGLASTAWERAARSAIGSRFSDVRDRAFREVLARHGEAAMPFFESVARKAADAPEAALAVMERAWKSKGGDASEPVTAAIRAMDPWEAASGLAELLEGGAAEARAKAAVALLDPKGGLAVAARARTPSEDARRLIGRLFMHWRGSDRGLLPFIEWAESTGLEDVGAEVREKRHMALRKITTFTDTTPLHELPRTFLTKLTFEKLKREAEALDVALRGEIPQAIQKARELGDLRENAEYESAKLKQRNAQARIRQLIEKMTDVSYIEDVPFVPDTVGLGTEVQVRIEGDGERRLWILGEGDDHLGSEVVSYKAPLGLALVGKKRGETVSLPGDGGERAGVIESVRQRLPEPRMILAGDVGGTKTDLSLFERVDGHLVERRTHRFESKAYPDLVSVLKDFLPEGVGAVESAGFGVPGPVVDGRCEATNLSWVVDVRNLASALGERHVTLVNDLVATAAGVLDLPADRLVTILEGKPHPSATRAVIAPGTGLGESVLYWDGASYHAVPSEAGHADFGGRNEEELALVAYLLGRFPRVSVERVLAGPGITHLYEFLRDTKRVHVPPEVDVEIQRAPDPNAAITQLALEKHVPVCVRALDLWMSILGAEAGNLALRSVAEGGVYLAGGIVGRLVEQIRRGPFAGAFLAKTPLDDFIREVPVRLVTEPRAALFGAARLAEGS